MQREFHNVKQNTEQWFGLRKGKFTASTFKDLFSAKSTATYKKAIYRPVYERLTDESPESFSNEYMERGHELEPLAIERYEMEKFAKVSPGGFHQYGEWIGDSPDGLIGDDGVLEVKSPIFNTMIDYLLKKNCPLSITGKFTVTCMLPDGNGVILWHFILS